MELLLRRTIGGGRETIDHELSGDRLRLGAGADCDFIVAGLPAPLTLAAAGDGKLRLSTEGKGLQADGRAASQLTITFGDTVIYAGLQLRLVEVPSGFDAALEVRGEVEGARRRHRVAPPPAPWSMRRTAWLLALLVLVTTLALPLAGSRGFFGETRLPGVPSDALWSSGPLSAAHRTAGLADNCSACHDVPFRMVEDSSCTGCHSALHEHAAVSDFPSLALAETRCASCHREHNEPERVVRRDPPLCTACHAEPELWRRDGVDAPLAVHRFTEAGHPDFRLASWEPAGDSASLGWRLVRQRAAAAELEEKSGLKFDHEVHLNPEKVQQQPDDAPLVCESCHESAGDGEHFAPVSMDNHCRSCHGLSFDPFDPDIELPHGDTRAAFEAMEAHFIREFTDPVLRAERAREKPRRLPGKRMGVASCDGEGLDCGRQEAAKEAAYQFADTGCVTCHVVVDTGAGAAIDRWFVHPVKLTQDWYPQSRFDHDAHRALPGRSGDDACVLCHEAPQSASARDVLMPGKDNCLDCHDSQRAQAAVDCVSCHGFHRDVGTPVHASRAIRGTPP